MKVMKIEGAEGLKEAVKAAVEVLEKGGVFAYPTETVYGLGTDPANESAVKKLGTLKERDELKAFSVMLPDVEALVESFPEMSRKAHALAEEFLPGGLTLILKHPEGWSASIKQTLGVRVPDHTFCAELSRAFGGPVITTSANRAGEPPATTADEVVDYFGDELDLIIDGGRSEGSVPSTVVDATGAEVSVLREGAIPESDIREVLERK